MNSSVNAYVAALFAVFTLSACIKDEPIAPSVPNIQFEQPAHFPKPVYQFENNKLSIAGFELGRQLFYDPFLSADNEISCGTCHKQEFAFADPAHRLPHGIDGQFGTRNSPGIFNTAWHSTFMWDGGVKHLEIMPLAPLTSPIEMGENLENIVRKLQLHPRYPGLFKAAFGSDSITSQQLFRAFAQFMGALVSANSKYDEVLNNKNSFSTEEKRGADLFSQHCANCHSGALFTDFSFKNNGLDSQFSDKGRGLITLEATDDGKFIVPSLRNVAVTPPYMHDGRFETLEQVLNHYTTGINYSQSLDPSLKTGIAINEQEKKALVAFLKTLTDEKFISDKRFANPFEK